MQPIDYSAMLTQLDVTPLLQAAELRQRDKQIERLKLNDQAERDAAAQADRRKLAFRDEWKRVADNPTAEGFAGLRGNDATVKALLDAGVSINVPPRFRKKDGKRVDWTPAQYDRLQVAVGEMARDGLTTLVKGDEWKAADDEGEQKLVSDLMREARAAGREMIEGASAAPTSTRGTAASETPEG